MNHEVKMHRSPKTLLVAIITAGLFTLTWSSDADALCRLRHRHTSCTENTGVPWYAYFYCPQAMLPTDTTRSTVSTCVSPPKNNPNYVAWCCYNGAWAKPSDLQGGSDSCQGSCCWFPPFNLNGSPFSPNAQNSPPPCPDRLPPLHDVRSSTDCLYALTCDACTGKLRYSYPCEYNVAGNPKVWYMPLSYVGKTCATCSR